MDFKVKSINKYGVENNEEKNICFYKLQFWSLPNQELSVLYEGSLSIMGDNYPCIFLKCSA